jgi:hypothetical protein
MARSLITIAGKSGTKLFMAFMVFLARVPSGCLRGTDVTGHMGLSPLAPVGWPV